MKIIFQFLAVFLILISCQKESNDPFLIDKTRVGLLTKEVQIRQLDSIFKNDSIVVKKENGVFSNGDEILIYDKKGAKLLRLDPVQSFDSTSTIGNIQILDPRFKTRAGFGMESTFKDIVTNYNISRIENTLNAIVIFIDEINAYVTIDKKELPQVLRGNVDQSIETEQIPKDAPISYFWIGWQ